MNELKKTKTVFVIPDLIKAFVNIVNFLILKKFFNFEEKHKIVKN